MSEPDEPAPTIRPPKFYVTVRRSIEVSVPIFADQAQTYEDAIALVQRREVALPPRNQWIDLEDWTYAVYRRRGGGRNARRSGAQAAARAAARQARSPEAPQQARRTPPTDVPETLISAPSFIGKEHSR